jgi:hypothetical protein
MIFQCDKHRRFTAKCYNCKLCRYIHKIDKKLWKKKLTLDQYTGIYSGGMPGTWFEGCE